MAVTSMRSITSLVKLLRRDFPGITFAPGDAFSWSHTTKTIRFIENSHDTASLLHELSHATLGHKTYSRDIELIGQERDAWAHAVKLAVKYTTTVPEEAIEEALDTYRDWLHARSTCPSCDAVGIQTTRTSYACVACTTEWHVNSAKLCALRRYKTKKYTP
jgi:hypothetical protein